jgi:DNA-binding response OmpR family regulator
MHPRTLDPSGGLQQVEKLISTTTALHHALMIGAERPVRDLMRTHLARAGFDIHEVAGGIAALARVQRHHFDLIVVDEMLSDLDGLAVCRAIRGEGRNTTTPIIVLLANGGVSDHVLGLESGADHCVEHLVDTRQLLARVRAVLRRTMAVEARVQSRRPLSCHGIAIDPEGRTVVVRGKAVDLTVQEFELLYMLASRPGVVFSRAALLSRLWPRDSEVTGRTVDTAISRLRGKIERSATPELLLTVWGIGYKFTA